MDTNGIDYLGLERVLKRGSGEIIAEQDDAQLIRDRISGAYMLACKNADTGISLLDRYIGQGCDLLMVSDHSLGLAAFERFGFSEKLECYQVAYYGDKPSDKAGLRVRTADERDLIGEHLEGSMGLLYVFPAYRHRGFGAALQTYLIARTMEKGYIPFGQVEKGNHASLALQKKLGMTRSDNLIVWMWK